MAMMVQPPTVTKTRLPAGFLTLLYNQCAPSLAPVKHAEGTHTCMHQYSDSHTAGMHAHTLPGPQRCQPTYKHHSTHHTRTTNKHPFIRPHSHMHTLTACVWAIVCDRELHRRLSVCALSVRVILKCQPWAFSLKIRC